MTSPIDDETELRALLHEAAGVASASDDLFSRVRSGAAHRRKTRTTVGALALVTAVLAGVGGALAAGSSGGAAPAVHEGGPLACAAGKPLVSPIPTAHAGLDKSLVPGSPVEGLVCTYVDTPSAGAVLSLAKSQALTGSALAAVVEALQGPVEQQGPGGLFCGPTGPHFTADLKFRYADGSDVTVRYSVESAVCQSWSNGVLSGSFGPLPPVLANLFPTR